MSAFIPPDWRDKSAYPTKADNLSLDQWVWEFLRRNPEYQNDYGYCNEFPDYIKQNSRHSLANSHDDTKFRYCEFPILAGETVWEYFNRTGDESPYFYSLEDHLIDKKWEILYLADPANDEGYDCIPKLIELPIEIYQDFQNTSNNKGYVPTETGWTEIEIEPKPREPEPEDWFEMTLRFDLRYSLDKQLDNAKILLQKGVSLLDLTQPDYPYHDWGKIRGAIGIQIENLPTYLRVYDGRQAGATYLEIGKELFRDEIENHDIALDPENAKQRAANAFKKAQELVQRGYRELMKQI